MTTPARILALAASVALLSVTTLAEAPEIQTLKNLKFASIEVPGASTTEAMGINNSGDIVGSWEDARTGRRSGFLRSGGVYTSIDIPGAVLTVANDINDAGDIVGTYYEPADAGELFGDSHGYLLSADGQLTTITVPGQRVTWAFGINNRGQIVGGYSEWSGDQVLGVHGFMLDTGTFTPIDFPVPTPRAHILVTYASGINDAGDIVGGYNEDDIDETRRGFVLRDGVVQHIRCPRRWIHRHLCDKQRGGDGRRVSGLRRTHLWLPVQPGPRISSSGWHRQFQAALHMAVALRPQ